MLQLETSQSLASYLKLFCYSKVLQLRQVIEQSKTTGELGWRGQNFISNLEEEGVPTNLIDSTIKFLDCLGANQVQATVNVPPRKSKSIFFVTLHLIHRYTI